MKRTRREDARSSTEEPFDIDEAFRRLRRAVVDLPKAAMFDLRDLGYSSPFEQLVGSLISARTRDETTTRTSACDCSSLANTSEQILALGEDELARLLSGSAFSEVKKRDILGEISRRLIEEWGGQGPRTAWKR